MTETVTHCPACGKQAAYVTRYGCAGGGRSPCALAHLPAEWPRSSVEAEGATAAWSCEAYGPEAAGAGALCFASEPGTRACATQAACHRVMAAERRRVFRRISEGAASGDQTMAFLEGEFSSPEQILGGGQEPGEGSQP
jgi:hypothetical protein